MNKHTLALVTLAVAVLSTLSDAYGQSRCGLTEKTSPTVRGIHLGMSADQILALFPGASKRREMKEVIEKAKAAANEEAVYLPFDAARDAATDSMAGIDSVSAGLLNGRVIEFTVQYGSATWPAVDQWIAKVSESFNLPPASSWVAGPSENPNKVLTCDGVQIEAAIQGGGSSISVRNTEALKASRERANASDEKKRREIKP